MVALSWPPHSGPVNLGHCPEAYTLRVAGVLDVANTRAEMDSQRQETVAHYRTQAAEARRDASRALTDANREGYLKLAEGWDQLADEIEGGTFGSGGNTP
jgi:hypothetical protein